MSKAPKLNMWVAVLGGGTLVYLANWLSVYWWQYPFLYCWTVPAIWPFYLAWANLINVIVICYFAYQALRKNMHGMLIGAFAVIVVMGLPVLANTAFRLGGVCG